MKAEWNDLSNNYSICLYMHAYICNGQLIAFAPYILLESDSTHHSQQNFVGNTLATRKLLTQKTHKFILIFKNSKPECVL